MSETYKGVDVEWAVECLWRAMNSPASPREVDTRVVAWGEVRRENPRWCERMRLRARHAIDHGYRPPEKVKSDADMFAAEMDRWFPLSQGNKVYWHDAMLTLRERGWKIEAPVPEKPNPVRKEA